MSPKAHNRLYGVPSRGLRVSHHRVTTPKTPICPARVRSKCGEPRKFVHFVGAYPELFDKAQLYLRLIASLGGALVGASLPGVLQVELPGGSRGRRFGGTDTVLAFQSTGGGERCDLTPAFNAGAMDDTSI